MKRLAIVIAYVLLSLTAVAGAFSLMALTSSTAYAHGNDRDYDSDADGDGGHSVNESRPVKPDGEVRVDNLAGTVRVEGWDKNEVRVSGSLGGQVERLEITGDDSSLSIRVILPQHNCRDCEADLQINVPRSSRLEVSTVSADVEANDVNGSQQLGTVSGNIILRSGSGRVEVRTVSGDVTVVGSAKNAQVSGNSVSGTVHISNVDGSVDAESVSGDVRVSASHLTGVKMSATSGNLMFQGTLAKGGNYDFHNVSGDVQLAVGMNPSARFDLSSFSGGIDNSFGPKPTRVSKYSPGMELRFTNGAADAEVDAQTMSGEIHLQN
ncbi:MAG TPA: DUF4097 family beta strand repeat-containing protein [Gammaproteobacteria bacterium]